MRESIEGIAFDLDGTLYPNHVMHIKLIPFAFKEFRLLSNFGKARNIIRKEQKNNPNPQDDFYQRQVELVAKRLGEQPQQVNEKIERLIYKGWEPLFKTVKLFKGVPETIAALRKAGYKVGLMSDFPVETKLEYLGLSGIWDVAMCSEHCGALKPHPKPFLELASAMSLPPEKILYVGNSHAYDVTGAHQVGMKTAWINNPHFPGNGFKKPKPDFSFRDYRQLYDYMLNYNCC
jgi:putative hydrolase of the HAD superfamily